MRSTKPGSGNWSGSPWNFWVGASGILLAEVRRPLADLVHCAPDDLVYMPNATNAVNAVARSLARTLPLAPGDEILTTDHEYGAAVRTWRFVCRHTDARLVHQPLPTPMTTPSAAADALWAGVTDRTKVIFLSHITSPTALILPVAEICRRAREAGILTVIDGAHAVGQIELDMGQIGADFYTSNAHKWLLAPKGAAFLFARPDRQAMLDPLVVSWGWESEMPGPSQFLDYFEWSGTVDPAAYLSVPAAIDFRPNTIGPRCGPLVLPSLRRCGIASLPSPVCHSWLPIRPVSPARWSACPCPRNGAPPPPSKPACGMTFASKCPSWRGMGKP